MISCGPSVISGTILGYTGVSPKGNKVISFQLEPWVVGGGGSRFILIPIPGTVIQVWVDSRNFESFLIDGLKSFNIDPVSIKGYDRLIGSSADSQVRDLLEPLSVPDLSRCQEVIKGRWSTETVTVNNDLCRMQLDLKPGWQYLLVKFDNTNRRLSTPLTIVYRGPKLLDDKGQELLYFPGVQNLKQNGRYFGLPSVTEVTKRSLFLMIGPSVKPKGSTPIDYSNDHAKQLIQKNVLFYSCYNTETVNGDIYYTMSRQVISIKYAGMKQALDLRKEEYIIG